MRLETHPPVDALALTLAAHLAAYGWRDRRVLVVDDTASGPPPPPATYCSVGSR